MYHHPYFVVPRPDLVEWAQVERRGRRHTCQTHAALPQRPRLVVFNLVLYLLRVGCRCSRGVGHRDTGLELDFVYCIVSDLSLADWFCLCDDGAGGGSFSLLENRLYLRLQRLGCQVPLNFVAEIISGLLLPGNPVANIVFKVYSMQSITQALLFLQDLKLGHYIKVPPRATFLGECV